MKKYGICSQWRQLATQVHGPVLCGVQHYPPPQKKKLCTKTRTSCLCSSVLISTQESNGDEDKFFIATNKPKQTVGWIQSMCLGRLHSVTSSATSQHSISMTQKNQCFTWSPLQPCHQHSISMTQKKTMLHSVTSSALSQRSTSMIQKNKCVTLLYLQLCHI